MKYPEEPKPGEWYMEFRCAGDCTDGTFYSPYIHLILCREGWDAIALLKQFPADQGAWGFENAVDVGKEKVDELNFNRLRGQKAEGPLVICAECTAPAVADDYLCRKCRAAKNDEPSDG